MFTPTRANGVTATSGSGPALKKGVSQRGMGIVRHTPASPAGPRSTVTSVEHVARILDEACREVQRGLARNAGKSPRALPFKRLRHAAGARERFTNSGLVIALRMIGDEPGQRKLGKQHELGAALRRQAARLRDPFQIGDGLARTAGDIRRRHPHPLLHRSTSARRASASAGTRFSSTGGRRKRRAIRSTRGNHRRTVRPCKSNDPITSSG